ncbi:metalloendoproteinase 1-like [Tripterygium wilfordii]|uniref:metalloendoproteinase 1-like n=1 Tax=Tripterygium wilfordii TaxID=458696 RepID=UPI0018F7F9FC|nr:metalloendoproteinase 1-like [Tripterygium wilfordii]
MASKLYSLLALTCLLLPLFSFAVLAYPNRQTTSSPFEFLSKLKGFEKGNTAEEISQLRKYLNRFGYLSNNNIQTQDVNAFDDNISSAIKAYQTFFNLKPTGTLDAETVSKMMAPRCGVPDIRMHGNNKTNLDYAFFPYKPRWAPEQFSLTYAFPPDVTFFRAYVMAPVASAFETWRSVFPNFTFTLIKDFEEADLKISFQKRDHGDGDPFDGAGGVLAHSFEPTDGRCHLDVEENWVVGAVADGFDIGSIALHEIGHLLGLAHTSVQNVVMYPFFSPGMTKLDLSEDDRQGIKALYSS